MRNVMAKFQSCGLKGVATIERTPPYTHTYLHLLFFPNTTAKDWENAPLSGHNSVKSTWIFVLGFVLCRT